MPARQLLKHHVRNLGEAFGGNLPTPTFLRNGVSELQPLRLLSFGDVFDANLPLEWQTYTFESNSNVYNAPLRLSFLISLSFSSFYEKRTRRQARVRACPSEDVSFHAYVGQLVLFGFLT